MLDLYIGSQDVVDWRKKVGLGIEGWRNQKLHDSKLVFHFKGACNVCTIRSGGVLEQVALSHTNC